MRLVGVDTGDTSRACTFKAISQCPCCCVLASIALQIESLRICLWAGFGWAWARQWVDVHHGAGSGIAL